MTRSSKSIAVSAVAAIATAALFVVGSASGKSTESYLHSFRAPPPCASAGETPDPTLTVCRATFAGSRIVLPSQSIVLFIGDAESSRADCAAYVAATTRTFAIDGEPVEYTASSCHYVSPNAADVVPFFVGTWAVMYRHAIEAGSLAPGTHTLTATTTYLSDFSYSLGCDDPSGRCTIPAGSVFVDVGLLTITH